MKWKARYSNIYSCCITEYFNANVLILVAIKLSYLTSIMILQGHRVMFREPYFFLWVEVALGAICVFVLEIRENQPKIKYNFSLKRIYNKHTYFVYWYLSFIIVGRNWKIKQYTQTRQNWSNDDIMLNHCVPYFQKSGEIKGKFYFVGSL